LLRTLRMAGDTPATIAAEIALSILGAMATVERN
jgi:hypothetical protein